MCLAAPLAATAGPQQSVTDAATFSTSGQSMWGPGGAAPPTDVTSPLFDQSWSASDSAGHVDSVDFDPCPGGGCNQHIGSFGGTVSASTSGEIGLSYTLHGQTGGSVGVTYPVHVTFTTPADDSFASGSTIEIQTKLSVDPGATMTTSPPTFSSVSLAGKFGFHAGVSGQICFVDCSNQNLSIDVPSSGTASGDVVNLSQSDLETIPGFGLTHCFTLAESLLLGFGPYTNSRCNNLGYLAFPYVQRRPSRPTAA